MLAWLAPDAMENRFYTVAQGNSVTRKLTEFTIVKPGETLLGENEPETLVGT